MSDEIMVWDVVTGTERPYNWPPKKKVSMNKILFYRTERDLTFEVNGKTGYTKVTVTDYGGNTTVFQLRESQIEEIACEVDRAKRRRITMAIQERVEREKKGKGLL